MKTPSLFHRLVFATFFFVSAAAICDPLLADEQTKKAVIDKPAEKGFTITNDILIEVEAGKKAYLSVPEGKLHPEQPDPEKVGFVELDFSKIQQPLMKVKGIYNFPNNPDRGEKLWDTLTADEMRKMYRDAGFALLPNERNSETVLKGTKLPKVVMFPTAGLIRVSQVTILKTKLSVRLQYRFYDDLNKVEKATENIL